MDFRVTKGGKVTLKMSAFSEGITYDVNRGVAEIFDFFEDLDVDIDYRGVTVHPTVIVKIYCKLSSREKSDIIRRQALEAARNRSPMLW